MLAPAYPSLADWFAHVYQPRRLLGCSTGTVHCYLVLLRQFSRWLGRPAVLADLDEDRLSEFLAVRLETHAAATISRERSQLLALAKYAHHRGLLTEVPDVMPIRLLRKSPTSYTPGDMGRLVAAGRGAAGEISGVPARLFWPALFLVIYDCGCRSGAAWALRWVDWSPPALLFRAEHAKQRSDQLLRVSQETVAAIEAIRRPSRDLIFAWPYCPDHRFRRVRAIFKAAGLPHGRHDQLQRIRRTTATLMHRAGYSATTQLGHSSDAVTRRHYLDTSEDVQAADILPRPVVLAQDRQTRLF
jgi:integrase